ncbi:MAG: FAD-dependent oxidoreductase [Methylobacteriaceae bacterium]|nr:FAD-dependent oxidoreductase [Methylobacteriaceae bacterium]
MQRVLLLGGGHAHVQVVAEAARLSAAGAAVTLVSDSRLTPYSGMLPGVLAGRREAGAMMIDLAALCARHGVDFIEARVEGFDRAARAARLADGRTIAGDLVAFDLGAVPDLSAIEGAAAHALPVKPIAAFLDAHARLVGAMERGEVRSAVVVGAGAAGVELACALRARAGAAPRLTLLDPGLPLSSLNAGVRRRAARALARRAIEARSGRAVAVTAAGVVLADGAAIAADAVLLTGLARPPRWFARDGLPVTEDGSLATRDTLQLVGEDDLFATGDCGHVVGQTYPKAGVFAVRQGPVLARNLLARLERRAPERWRAQSAFLVLLDLGDGTALGGRGGRLAFEGRWARALKDRIDEGFVARFR